jgi:hypothetical protein
MYIHVCSCILVLWNRAIAILIVFEKLTRACFFQIALETILFIPIKVISTGMIDILECNKVCTFDYKPVCGSDSVTYPNKCGLEIATCKSADEISLAYEGECRKSGKYIF